MLDRNPGILIKKYSIVSFVMLCCIISAYQSLIFILPWTQNNDAHKVNLSGRQRMLSQRIGKNLSRSANAETEQKRLEFLALAVADLNTLATNHAKLENEVLTSRLFKNNSKIKQDFLAIKQPVTQMVFAVKNIAELNKNLEKINEIKQYDEIYFANEKVFIGLMDDIVKCYEIGLENYVTQLKNLSWIGAGFILISMFINGRFVVFKSIREVEAQFTQIKNHKEFQDTILSCSLEGIITINTAGEITLINKTAEGFFLGTQKDFLYKKITTLIPDFDADYLEAMQERYEIELNGLKKENILFPVLVNVSKIEAGNRQGWVIFIKDLSLKKKIEQELSYAKKSVVEAVEANNAKSKFVANMSHELRTPLNSIIGFSQLLQTDTQSPLTPEHSEYISYINQAGTHLLSLINEILDLAKLESGQLSLSLEIVNISAVMKEVLILIYTLASKKHIEIVSLFETLPDYYIVVDRVRIKQVLLNLLSNAIKYNQTNGSVTIYAETQDNQSLKISITDTGHGIPAHKISNLFDPFNRLGAENSGIEGTGIGLTITKGLVEDMQGKIGVLSEENKGSTFWVEFPLAENQRNFLENNPKASITPCQLPDNCQIVYIEDNPINTELIKSFVQRIPSAQLHSAENAKTGLELIEKINPDIILIDIDLPDLNGFEMLEIIRKRFSDMKNTPVIAISAHGMKEDIKNGLDAGFSAYITKPVKMAEFYETINYAMAEITNKT